MIGLSWPKVLPLALNFIFIFLISEEESQPLPLVRGSDPRQTQIDPHEIVTRKPVLLTELHIVPPLLNAHMTKYDKAITHYVTLYFDKINFL